MDLEDDSLIYLDLDFISRKYEDKFGTDPGTKSQSSRDPRRM